MFNKKFKKTLSSLMLISLAMFLLSFTPNQFTNNFHLSESENKISLNSDNAIVTSGALSGLNVITYASTGGRSPGFSSQLSTTTASNISYSWGDGAILNSGRSENVIVRFYGWIIPNHTGATYFYAPADDGVRIQLGSSSSSLSLFYDDWVDKGGGGIVRTYNTVVNQPLYIQLDYYENGGGAHVQLQWSSNGSSYSVVPSTAFTRTYPTSTLTFNSNSGTPVNSIIGEVGLSFTLPTNPTRSGYIFDGWFYDNNSFSNAVNTNFFPLTNQTAFAKWVPIPVTVNLDRAGGIGGPDSVSGSFGQNLQNSSSDVPTKEGHVFNGYYSGINGTGNQYYNSSMIGNRPWDYLVETTLYAYWTLENHTISFNLNYDNPSSIVQPINQNYGSLITKPANPIRSGYTFDGWYNESSLVNSFIIPDIMPDYGNNGSFKNIYAGWTIESYTINFDLNYDGSINNIEPIISNYNQAIYAPQPPTRVGYKFIGWYQDINLQNEFVFPNSMPDIGENLASTVLFAKWQIETYNFEFKINYGSNETIASFSALFQDSIDNFLPLDPTRTGYSFLGWSLNQSETNPDNIINIENFEPNLSDLGNDQELITYYSIWQINNYEITVQLNNDDINPVLIFEFDSNINIEIPIKQGYEFDYWSPTLPDKMPAFDFTVTAVYKRTSVPNDFSLNNTGSNFENGYLKFSLGIFDETAHIFLDNILDIENPGSNIEQGIISIIGNTVYYGNGSEVLPFALIDNIDNGDFGNDLLITIYESVDSTIITNLIKSVKYSSLNEKQLISVESVDANDFRENFVFVNEAPVDSVEFDTLNLVNEFSFNEDSIFRIDFDFSNYFSDLTNIQYRLIENNNYQTDHEDFVYFSGNSLYGLGDNDRVGINYIVIQAFNSEYISDEFVIAINIINTNDAPTLNPIYQNFKINIPFDEQFTSELPSDFMLDVDLGTSISYSILAGLPACINFDPETRTFSGRCDQNSDISQIVIVQGSDGIELITYYISFTMDLTIEFETNGGTLVESQTVPYNGLLRTPEEPSKVGHTFMGWYTDIALANSFDFSYLPLDLIVYAKWNINQYSIEFYVNGGTFVNTITQDYNTNIVTPINPTRQGYEFIGWNPIIPNLVPANNMIINAQWRPLNYQISFDLMYITNNQLNAITAYYEQSIIGQKPSNPTRAGYIFDGWFEEMDLVNVYNIPNEMPFLGEEYTIKTLYAKWTPIIYRINYNGMLVPNVGNPNSYTIESSIINLRTAFLYVGHEFQGFYDNPSFDGQEFKSIPSGSIGDINLYAKWVKRKYNLVFKDDKGTVLSSEIVEYDQTIDTSFFPNTEKDGYEFIGFGDSLPSRMPASDVEVKAQYRPRQYKLTIKDSFGFIFVDELVDFESSLSEFKLPEVEKKGFEFLGWEPSLPDKMPNSEILITGTYRELPKYKVIIYGTQDQILSETEFLEKDEVIGVNLPDLSNSIDFVFEGWSIEVPTIMPGNDVEIRPIGTKRESTLNLYSADRTLISTIQAQIGSNLSITSPTRMGYSFIGWTDSSGNTRDVSIMPANEENVFASWQPKQYSVLVTVGANDINLMVTFGEPLGNIETPQLFGFRFEGWKNNLTGEFLNSNTIFTSPEEINLVPVFTRLNAGETLIAATRFIANFILSLFK